MRMSRVVRIGLCACLLLVVAPLVAAAQESPPPEREQPELVFEREVFQYPRFQRRNPFTALSAAETGAVRFEQLDLMGIIWSENPSESVCVLGTGNLTIDEDGTGAQRAEGDAWYAHVGETVGNVKIIEIHPDRVVVEVELFGIAEQRVMHLETRRLGGTP
jgi:hypothetical protein